MAAEKWWEEGLNTTLWHFGGRCPTCGGILKYRYTRADKPGMELQIFPNKRTFRLLQGPNLLMEAPIELLKERLDVIQ